MTLAPLFISRLSLILALALPFHAHAAQTAQAWFGEQGYVPPAQTRIIACHGYGCARRMALVVDAALLTRARGALRGARTSPEAERKAIGDVVRSYTAYLARQFGGRPDLPGSPPQMSGVHGQMDCLDESANTTSLLLVLQDQGLLVHHRVQRPQSRGFFIDGRYPHTTAVIGERKTGREWAVDPWGMAPGQRPDILPIAAWRQAS
ncbi:hypothetical protein ACFOYU_08680 [Microvirga sp. GCM10011540]|uniref:hypothetical protein n=1 Tax=Microvirga sp. GCM10011540 TaxID=3317338 RepID=UPI0036170210